MSIDTYILEHDADYHDRDRILQTAAHYAGDVAAGSGEVPRAILTFGTDVTVHTPTDDTTSAAEFVAATTATCEGHPSEYGLAVVYPEEHGVRIWTVHEGDELGTVDHGIRIPTTRVFRYVTQAELH